ncbi:MAG TPA: hypothetical protein VFI25_05175 [Planctomycetota bacterium]|jgi:hypothetical protein|nr:hypothetical protein [Planctomycetota bacterium]
MGKDGRIRGGGCRGTTLVEVLAALTTFVSLALVILGVERSALRGIRESDRAGEVVERTNRLADRIDREVRTAGVSTLRVQGGLGLAPPVESTDYSEMQFQRATGFTTAGVVYGGAISLQFNLEPGETANGTDDDGDGLVDEGTITLQEPATAAAVIARGVTEFAMRLEGRALVVTLEIGIPGIGGTSRTHRVVRTVRLRNN